MKKILIAILVLFTLFCFIACNESSSITCPECGYANAGGVKFCSECGASMTALNDNNQNSNNNENNQTDENKNTISVSNTTEFLNEIIDNSKISLSSGIFDFKNIHSLNNSLVQKNDDIDSYTISDVENLVIEGESTTIVIPAKNGYEFLGQLYFNNCKNIVFKNIVFKTVSKNTGDWYGALRFSDCQNIKFEDCSFENLSFCLDIARTTDFSLKNCKFKNIEYTSVGLWDVENIIVDKCRFQGTGDVFHSTRGSLVVKESTFEDINDSSIFCDDLYDYLIGSNTSESEATFEKCTFKNNRVLDFFHKTLDDNYSNEYSHDKIKFNNCSFTNNVYVNGDLNASNYLNCTLTNNSIGVEVLDFTYWDLDSALEFLDNIRYSIEYTYEDIEADCKFSSPVVVSQSKSGIINPSETISLSVSQPAISIQSIDIDIDSANGVEPSIKFTNHTDKQIAYIYFTIKFYDRMGSPAYCSIRDTHTRTIKVTGPINAGEQDTRYWDPVIYNAATAAIKPLTIKIEFTDGSKQTITCINGRYWYTGSYYGGSLRD